MTKYRYKLAIILLLMPTAGFALETLSILVVGLMRDQAVVQINGRQHVLKTGQSSPEGVALVEANSEFAVLQFCSLKVRHSAIRWAVNLAARCHRRQNYPVSAFGQPMACI